MKKFYETLGLNENATLEEVEQAYNNKCYSLYMARENMSRAEYARKFDELTNAHDRIIAAVNGRVVEQTRISDDERAREEAKRKREAEEARRREAEEARRREAEEARRREAERKAREEAQPVVVQQQEPTKKSGTGARIATTALALVLAGVIGFNLKGCSDQYSKTGAELTGRSAVTETINDNPEDLEQDVTVQETPSATETPEATETPSTTETSEATETPEATENTQDENENLDLVWGVIGGRPEENTNQEDTQEAVEEARIDEADAAQEEEYQNTQEEVVDDYSDTVYNVDYGDVMDDTLVYARAQELVDQLNAAGVVCPRTQAPYEVDHIVRIIKFLNGVLIPDSQEEIDLLYFDALDLTTAQMNTDYYLWHMNHASGECGDDFLQLINDYAPNATHVEYGEALTKYNGNGVWPLIQWIQEKRKQSFSTTNREEKDAIMIEVYQVLADIMKGDGATITIYDGKEAKEGITYTFTHDQILANPAAAFLLMQEAKYILIDCRIYDPGYTWDVYNSLNTDGVDANGYPIVNPDEVSLIEIEEYYNNGCYDSISQFIDEINTQEIDQLWPDGKTFAQITQMKIEGEALNNFVMSNDGVKLTK